jgi:hypothetical protein
VDGQAGSVSDEGRGDKEEGNGDGKPHLEGRISRFEGQFEVQWTHWWNEKRAQREREEVLWELETGRRWTPWGEKRRRAGVPKAALPKLYSDVLRGN